ncbi:fluoride efflux transporter CrcB [bacterium BMS3Abin03]|jgi:CrcB protein|nr:fluoride efflux transporter CrcB [bacterium BMS3Abin03]MCG6960948.1 fluoride efflux transporter CrcB [bacterium BMS3Abin03]
MINYILVGIGAAIGGTFRYWISNVIFKIFSENFPYGTLVVNVTGSFILGILMFYFNDRELLSPQLRLFLTVGFCGGFTTFSTFSFETMNLFRETQYLLGSINILLNLMLCLIGVFLAYLVTKLIG